VILIKNTHILGGSETLPSAYILSEKPTLRVTGIMKDEGNDDDGQNAKVDGRVEQFQEVLKNQRYVLLYHLIYLPKSTELMYV